MSDFAGNTDAQAFMDLYDTEVSRGGFVCRVCGVLVPKAGDYPKVHWDWHEASNGA